MNGRDKQQDKLTPSVWLQLVLVATLLLAVNDANAQELNDVNAQVQNEGSMVALSGLPTLAEITSTKVNENIKQIVAQLDSPSFTRREDASQQLVSENVSRRQICKVLSENDLSPEQRNRLIEWLSNDLITTPHAAIGISMANRRINDAIFISALIEDLPAIEVLEPGDQIISIDGLAIKEQNQFLQSIGSRKPGDKVVITVKRSNGLNDMLNDKVPEVRELDFEIVLGSDELLFDVNGRRTGNAMVQRALHRDLITIVQRYGPKILRIKGGEVTKLNLGTIAESDK